MPLHRTSRCWLQLSPAVVGTNTAEARKRHSMEVGNSGLCSSGPRSKALIPLVQHYGNDEGKNQYQNDDSDLNVYENGGDSLREGSNDASGSHPKALSTVKVMVAAVLFDRFPDCTSPSPIDSAAILRILENGYCAPADKNTLVELGGEVGAIAAVDMALKSFADENAGVDLEELYDLIHRPAARETALAAKFKTKGGTQLKEYCKALTKEDCRRQRCNYLACEKVHFRRIIVLHTDISLGDCSFLDTCQHIKTCKYVHYELDPTPDLPPPKPLRAEYCSEIKLGEPQWINCDIHNFRMDILGLFGVIMADPPWDIHIELPYGTMPDDEMRNLNVPTLQTDDLIFLWVTGRAMELGRECLELWGYRRIEELIWVKTNQLQRIIKTGRTGHWSNHSKEHGLVGIKGDPEVNRIIATVVVVGFQYHLKNRPLNLVAIKKNLKAHENRKQLFSSNASRGNPFAQQRGTGVSSGAVTDTKPPPWTNGSNFSASLPTSRVPLIDHSNSSQLRVPLIDHSNSSQLRRRVGGDGATSIQMEGYMQQQMIQRQDSHMQSRATALQNVESTISELGNIFTQLATMVAHQGELAIRIDDNMDDTLANVEGAQGALLKHLSHISSNRWLIIKILFVLIIFMLIFIVFVA